MKKYIRMSTISIGFPEGLSAERVIEDANTILESSINAVLLDNNFPAITVDATKAGVFSKKSTDTMVTAWVTAYVGDLGKFEFNLIYHLIKGSWILNEQDLNELATQFVEFEVMD